jgi:DNA-directed RNA polymerase subunit L
MSDDLPEPEGPMMAVNSPGSIFREIFFKTTVSAPSVEKVFPTLFSSKAGIIADDVGDADAVARGKPVQNLDVVAGVDDMSAGHPELLPDRVAKLIGTADFADERILDCVGDVDVIFHMAAVPRVSYSVEHPLETHVTNYDKTVQMLDAVADARNSGHVKYDIDIADAVQDPFVSKVRGADELCDAIWQQLWVTC